MLLYILFQDFYRILQLVSLLTGIIWLKTGYRHIKYKIGSTFIVHNYCIIYAIFFIHLSA